MARPEMCCQLPAATLCCTLGFQVFFETLSVSCFLCSVLEVLEAGMAEQTFFAHALCRLCMGLSTDKDTTRLQPFLWHHFCNAIY